MKPKRPALLQYSGVRELYLHFERIFLDGGAARELQSACGHALKIFDHHFFHMVKLDDPAKPKPLLMANERNTILTTNEGFGPYAHDKQRAIYLEPAMVCLVDPDEVWEDPSLHTAKWIYVKQFDAKPYSCTIFLIGARADGLVPITSFGGKGKDWRK
jgi:hypothetical protein